MNSSGFKMNSGNSQQLRNNFIKNRIKSSISKKKPMRGIGQDPIQRQAMTGSLNSAMGNTLQKYKMNTNDGYDSQIDAQQKLQDAGGSPQEMADKLTNAMGSLGTGFADNSVGSNMIKHVGTNDPTYRRGDDSYAYDMANTKFQDFSLGKGKSNRNNAIQDVLANYMERMVGKEFKAKKPVSRRPNRPVETPQNALSDTLMRYLQGMFNGGF